MTLVMLRRLIKLIEDYNVKLLSTKVYWDSSEEREKYKKFWAQYTKATNSEAKEILILQRELSQIDEESSKNIQLRKLYKAKLVEFGVMKQFKNSFLTGKKVRYIKK